MTPHEGFHGEILYPQSPAMTILEPTPLTPDRQ